MRWCHDGIIYAHEVGWSGHFSAIDAKVASVLVPEPRARNADEIPMIWRSGAQPMKAAGCLTYLLSGGLEFLKAVNV